VHESVRRRRGTSEEHKGGPRGRARWL
jgi:hypothetical protein